ncbi:hypothetical protein KFE25_014359 [Diacronema lutheri]|uniref:Uncharacterized protein n=1 Tax=Diacronema lutheri TaxID=2081491 RepID=A0A8J5X713_DIALT|nr:hypothetical protein KFE25_014359 [Diacronema lutheri]
MASTTFYIPYDHVGSRAFYERVGRDREFPRGINGPIFSRGASGGGNANGIIFWSDVLLADRPSSPRVPAGCTPILLNSPRAANPPVAPSAEMPPPPPQPHMPGGARARAQLTVRSPRAAAAPSERVISPVHSVVPRHGLPERPPSSTSAKRLATAPPGGALPTLSDDALASHVRSCRSSLGGTEAAGASVAERLHPPRARLSPRTPPARLAFYNDVSGWVPAGGVDFSPTVNFKIYNPLAYR